jgi:hypothetical protein
MRSIAILAFFRGDRQTPHNSLGIDGLPQNRRQLHRKAIPNAKFAKPTVAVPQPRNRIPASIAIAVDKIAEATHPNRCKTDSPDTIQFTRRSNKI